MHALACSFQQNNSNKKQLTLYLEILTCAMSEKIAELEYSFGNTIHTILQK